MVLRKGFTTGTAATAALKASLLFQLYGEQPEAVVINLPDDKPLTIKIEAYQKIKDRYFACVIKDAGDDADITHGCLLSAACVLLQDSEGITFDSEYGVGRVTLEGLGIPVGEPAVNAVPRKMMRKVLSEFGIKNARIIINVENGEGLAKSTLNNKVGVKGGISILGTSGIVEPMSEQAWRESLLPMMDVLKAKGYDDVVLVLGGRGEEYYLQNFGVHENIIICGNHFGYAIRNLIDRNFRQIHLCGAFQKMIKLSGGNLNTDSRYSDSKNELMALYYLMDSGVYDGKVVSEILTARPFSSVVGVLEKGGVDIGKLFDDLCEAAVSKLKDFFDPDADRGIVFRVTMMRKDTVIGDFGEEKR